MYYLSVALALLVVGLHAWSAEPPAAVAAVIELTAGVDYRVAQLNDSQLTSEAAPTLMLDATAERASGFSGVNRYGGGYTLTGNQLTFGQMMGTRMAGDAAATTIEQTFLALIAAPLTVTATAAGVELRNATGSMRLVPYTK